MNMGEILVAASAVALACVGACSSSDSPVNPATIDAGSSSSSSSSSGSPADTDSGPTASTYAQALCAWNERCDPAANLLRYGSLAACLSATDRYVALARAAPESAITDPALDACTAAANAAPCTQYPPLLDACIFKGPRADGAACAFGEQCRVGLCLLEGANTCGTCAAGGGLADSCAQVPFCQAPLRCDGTSKCAARAASGSPCTRRVGCESYLDRCVNGTCVLGAAKDAACTATNDTSPSEDSCGPSLLCVNGTCTDLKVTQQTGQTCGGGVECINGACVGDGPPYTCVARLHEGDACGGSIQGFCGENRLQCLSGKCAFGPPPGACN